MAKIRKIRKISVGGEEWGEECEEVGRRGECTPEDLRTLRLQLFCFVPRSVVSFTQRPKS
ncbi:unnamed protein product [Ectocarpus sp. 8 AP-2014]